MKCPECGNDCKKGYVKAEDAGSFTQLFTQLLFFPEEEKKKLIKRGAVRLNLRSQEAYYCDECMKVFAVFEEK